MKKEFSKKEIISNIQKNEYLNATVEQLYINNYKQIKHLVESRGFGYEDAQDIFQDTILVFLAAVRNGKFIETSAAISTYLFSVAKHKMYAEIRKRSRHIHLDTGLINNNLVDSDEDDNRLVNIYASFLKLPETCQKVLKMYYLEEQDLETIAIKLGYKLGSISVTKHRCIHKLKIILQNEQQDK